MDGTRTAYTHDTDHPEIKELRPAKAYIKWSLGPTLQIEDSYNVTSVTDSGTNCYSVNFGSFKTSNIVCTPVGTTPTNFRVLSVSRDSIALRFEGTAEPKNVALLFEEVALG